MSKKVDKEALKKRLEKFLDSDFIDNDAKKSIQEKIEVLGDNKDVLK